MPDFAELPAGTYSVMLDDPRDRWASGELNTNFDPPKYQHQTVERSFSLAADDVGWTVTLRRANAECRLAFSAGRLAAGARARILDGKVACQDLSAKDGRSAWTAAATGKNIVVFSDGTGQEGGVGVANTNVYKLFMMSEDRTAAQVVFYDRGLGTGPRSLIGGVTGRGITQNILEAYQFISDNYECGDQLFFFGFSRGATTVRSLAGFIALFGLLPHSRPDLVERAYAIYRDSNPEHRKADGIAFLKRNGTTWCNIKFVGVWDTVAALGIPLKGVDAVLGRFEYFKHSFHDLALNPVVQHAYHALAIDEEREIFAPTPWHIHDRDGKSLVGEVPVDPRESGPDEQERKDRRQVVRQVWFCGVHTDAGGGYEEHGVSDIALAWMIDRARDCGLRLRMFHPIELAQNPADVIHDSRSKWSDKLLFAAVPRTWDRAACGRPVIHASVLARKLGKAEGKGELANVPYRSGPAGPATAQEASSTSLVPIGQLIERINAGLADKSEYEEEPWDNELMLYGMPIEEDYRGGFDPRKG